MDITRQDIYRLVGELRIMVAELRLLAKDLPSQPPRPKEPPQDRYQALWDFMGDESWGANELFRRVKGELGWSESTTRRYLARGVEERKVYRLEQGPGVQYVRASSPQAKTLLADQQNYLAYWLLRSFYPDVPTRQLLVDVLAPALDYGVWSRARLVEGLEELAKQGLVIFDGDWVYLTGLGVQERARLVEG